jgi:hypothetical protein
LELCIPISRREFEYYKHKWLREEKQQKLGQMMPVGRYLPQTQDYSPNKARALEKLNMFGSAKRQFKPAMNTQQSSSEPLHGRRRRATRPAAAKTCPVSPGSRESFP